MSKKWSQDTLDDLTPMYGIWIYSAESWMGFDSGAIFFTSDPRVAEAQLERVPDFNEATAIVCVFGDTPPVAPGAI